MITAMVCGVLESDARLAVSASGKPIARLWVKAAHDIPLAGGGYAKRVARVECVLQGKRAELYSGTPRDSTVAASGSLGIEHDDSGENSRFVLSVATFTVILAAKPEKGET
jgi:hypothetical protein